MLVAQEGREVFRAAYGYANLSWRVPNHPDTRFRVASISKMFTAVAVLQLVDAKILELDTPVAAFLGLEDTALPEAVTTAHLLTMSAGIADWFDESGQSWDDLRRDHPLYLLRRNADYLPLFINKPPIAPVGEVHRYSNSSYILLGLMIERASGLSYFDYVRRSIFERAQMTRSDFLPLDGVAEAAEGYLSVGGAWQTNVYSVTPEAAADGGATSTLDDLAKFSSALREGRLLSAELTRAALTPKMLEDDEPYRGYTWMYGYGNLFLLDGADRIVRWGHSGEEDGVSCRLFHFPQQGVDALILGNQSRCAGKVGWEVHNLVTAL